MNFSLLICLVAFCCLAYYSTEAKTVLITGANRGIGLATVQNLVARNNNLGGEPWDIVMACRSVDRAKAAIKKIDTTNTKIEVRELDLGDLDSVKSFASSWGSKKIDCLALNAGIQPNKYEVTSQGFESTVGINHIGHFYLMNLLLPNVKKTGAGRVVFVGSGVHNPDEAGGNVGSKATLGDLKGFEKGFQFLENAMVDGEAYDGDKAYKDSKLCNVITCFELAKRLKSENSKVTANVMNPGLIPTTGLFRAFSPLFVIPFTFLTRTVFKVAASEEEGGARLSYLIQSPELEGVSGKYLSTTAAGLGLSEFMPITPSVESRDETKAKKFWELTKKLIKDKGYKI